MRLTFAFLVVFGLVTTLPCWATESSAPKLSDKMGVILQTLVQLQERHMDMFGVRPSRAWPLSQDLMAKRQSCSGPSDEELKQAMRDGLVNPTTDNKDFKEGCSRDDNPVGDERAFNCYQIGKWQAEALPLAKQLLDRLPQLSFKVILVYKETPKELGDILIDYFNFDLPAYCSELAGRYASAEARTFNEFLEDRRAFGRVLEAAKDRISSAHKQALSEGM
ncbi:MAG: hypothetical protein KDD43_15310 [Bdellovibrionales bacterium]|nr:hypothetical protein [Bdellovibrionales bacterium]